MASKLPLLLAELRRRKVYRVAAVYVVVGLGILGAAEVILDPLGLGALRAYVVILVLLGFPIALVLAWAYEVKPEQQQALESAESERTQHHGALPSEDLRPSLAVLPFANLSLDPKNEFFGLGVMDDVLTRLTAVGGLRVISRASVIRYLVGDKSTPEIARELGVTNLLEGSVRREGNRVRVVAQLVDAKTDEHLWASTYDRDLEDVFRVQTDVAESIALALRAELSAEERKRVRRVPTENLAAYDRFVRAVGATERMLPEDLAEAEEHCQEAIRLDPGFAKAYAVLAQSRVMAGLYANQHPAELFPKIQEAASRALELDPQCVEARTAMAAFKLHYEWDSVAAGQELARALALNPDASDAHLWQGDYLLCHGRFDEAETEVRRALASDPLSPLAHHDLGKVLALSGRPAEAVQVSRAAADLWPDLPTLHLWTGTSHFLLNEPEEALPSFEKAAQLSGGLPFFESMRGLGLAVLGLREEARTVLEGLKTRSLSEYVDPYNLFQVTAALDGLEDALPYLEEALEVRSFFLPYLGVLPPYKSFHNHPRFRAVLDKIWPGVSFEV